MAIRNRNRTIARIDDPTGPLGAYLAAAIRNALVDVVEACLTELPDLDECRLLTVAHAAAMLDCSEQTVLKLVGQGELERLKLITDGRITYASIRAYQERQREAAIDAMTPAQRASRRRAGLKEA